MMISIKESLDYIYRILIEGGHSLVILTPQEQTLTFSGRGVIDLYRCLTQSPDSLSGALVADRAVGLGAAALMASGKIKALKTPVISQDALKLLESRKIPVDASSVVPFIVNRTGTGRCPLEQRLSPLSKDDLPGLVEEIAAFLAEKNLIF